jgi:hypothetical protein
MRIAALAGFAFFVALNGTVATAAVGDGWHLAPGSSGFTMGTGAVTGSMLRLPANGCNVDTLCSTRS